MNNLAIVQQQVELAKVDFETNVDKMKLDLSFEKEKAFAMQVFQGNDYLTKMNPDSIRNAIVNVALTGLTLNPVMKFAYLIPRKGKCVLDVSYMGLVKILTDTGSVKNLEAKVVYANEPFEIEQGTNPYVRHGITRTAEKGIILGVYSIATLNDGSTSVEWMYYQDIVAVANRSESVKKGSISPWSTDFTEMARKTVVKRHYKYLPKSERAILAATAIDIDHENNGIDFEAEKAEKETINITDIVSPNDQNNVASFQQIIDYILFSGKVPELFDGVTSNESFVEALKSEFYEGKLTTVKANNIATALNKYA